MRVRSTMVALSLAAAPSAWADFDAGQAAFDAGRFGEALAEWRAAADEGDGRAMLALGRVHVRGVGALQNFVEAHMWLNLAARRGESAAAEERDALAAKMTAEQVALAQDRATRWQPRGARSDFRDCPHCPEMVVVRPGSFMMGSPPSEEDRWDNEGPQHRVTIGAAFAVGVYEVTFSEWEACASAGGCGGYRPHDQRWGRGRRPVINVSWDDAQSYVAWLSGETGESYRLLSESEWEYVARAGTQTRYWWGDDIGDNRANCDGCGSRWDDDGTAPVGSFAANAFGLHDVHGNVWEWVQDCWNDSYVGAPNDGSAWESGECSRRVLRGGSWYLVPRLLRAADRGGGATGAGATSPASVWPGRSPLDSLLLYLSGGPGGLPPGRIFFGLRRSSLARFRRGAG